MTTESILVVGGGTGGHVFPGLAIADALRTIADVEVGFVGSARGLEAELVPARGYKLTLLDTAPMKGGGIWRFTAGGAIAAKETARAIALVKRAAPRAILSVGGYAAGPVALAGAILRVPLAVVEPNAVLGFANRLLLRLAQRAYVAWEETVQAAPKEKVRVFGVPLRRGFSPSPYLPTKGRLHVVVLGGSQGATALNERVPRALARLASAGVSEVRITHQTGKKDEAKVRALYDELGVARATVAPFLDDVPAVLASADLVIARSGAGTVAEVSAVGRAALYVPFPFAADDHQAKNAERVVAIGGASMLRQDDATVDRLYDTLDELARDAAARVRMADAARSHGRPDAAHAIAADLIELAGLPRKIARGTNGVAKSNGVAAMPKGSH